MKKILLLSLAIFVISFTDIYAQFAIRHQIMPPKPPDSLDIAHYSKKNGWLAAGEIFSLNMGLWAFDRYALKADYAYINSKTIKKNFKHGFVWDNDDMGNNMFLHPYHGSLYYNAARSNGFNYWESGMFNLGGSLMWELFMENEYPSVNDIIATPVGGMTLGEVFYRSSDLILDDRSTGTTRFGREAATFLISPTRGLTRIINGDAWRRRSTSGKQFGVPDVSVDISVGARALEIMDQGLDKDFGITMNLNVEYGDRFESENQKPYDYFSFETTLNRHSSQPVLSQLNIVGRLHVTDLIDNEKHFLSLGAYQHFDYYDSDTILSEKNEVPYKVCTPASFGGGLIYKSKHSKRFSYDAFLHVNAVLLGGTLSDYYKVDKRNYNLASGISWKSGFNFAYKDKLGIAANYNAYLMYTWKGYPQDINWDTIDIHDFNYQGDKSRALLHVISLRGDWKLRDKMYLSAVFLNFRRDTNYKYYDDVFSKTHEGRLMLTYRF